MTLRTEPERAATGVEGQDDPLWYKDAVIYELHVRAFFDSNDDGIGDFPGLTQKLDYLQELGVTALWLLPFYPSPLLDDGYDIADYTDVHPNYGSRRDVRNFIREAHRRGMKVITELVCNHTSDQHPWFQRARRAPEGSAARNFYVWSDTPDKYKEARIIFKDFESSNWSFDQVAGAHYWHRFYRHQPDLNFENPRVHAAIRKAMDFWLEMGVDGLRLDAVPYLYEREGTSCENLPETYEFLKRLRAHIDQKFPNRMLLAEANQWPEDAVAYFGDGDMCQMAFQFPLMPRLFMSIHMEDRFPIVDILRQTPAIPENCQWAVFLRNHDELTLEMVTDEERDYMYRVYATDQRMRINLGIRRRLAPLLGNHRRRVELMNGLLFAMPGTPVIYYGDELGMGDNVYLGDRNGVRTPMQWSADRNAGFSRTNPQRLFLPVITDPEYNYETLNVEAQMANQHSMYWWTRRLIGIRKRFKAFGRGSFEVVPAENRKIFAFIRAYEDERVLVVANLSRFVQGVELDLSKYQGMRPVEIFGRVEMPVVGEVPYFLTLGPHSFYWFSLEGTKVEVAAAPSPVIETPAYRLKRGWEGLLHGEERGVLEAALPAFLMKQRWFAGKGRRLRGCSLADVVPLRHEGSVYYIAFISLQYDDGVNESQVVVLGYTGGETANMRHHDLPDSVIMRVRTAAGEDGVLYGAAQDEGFANAILEAIEKRQRLRSPAGDLTGLRTFVLTTTDLSEARPNPLRREQSNTSIAFGDKAILKLFRRLEAGVNPDLEIGRFLTERGFKSAPRVLGAVEYSRPHQEKATLAILHEYIENEGDAWALMVDALRDFFDTAQATAGEPDQVQLNAAGLVALSDQEPTEQAVQLIGPFLDLARLLGKRTAELHAALASDRHDPDFAPEPFTPFYQRGLYQSMRNQTANSFSLLRTYARTHDELAPELNTLLNREDDVLMRMRGIVGRVLKAPKMRAHGDLHLGQVLYTGDDFLITDFEGEPARPLTERKIKRTPIRDVAGMLRSFDYAVHAALREERLTGIDETALGRLEAWGRFWQAWISACYLGAYLAEASASGFLAGAGRDEIELLLDVHMIEKAVYELAYELNNRPNWLAAPARGLVALLEARTEARNEA